MTGKGRGNRGKGKAATPSNPDDHRSSTASASGWPTHSDMQQHFSNAQRMSQMEAEQKEANARRLRELEDRGQRCEPPRMIERRSRAWQDEQQWRRQTQYSDEDERPEEERHRTRGYWVDDDARTSEHTTYSKIPDDYQEPIAAPSQAYLQRKRMEEEAEACLKKLEDLGFVGGSNPKFVIKPAKKKGNPRHNEIYPTQVGYPNAAKEAGTNIPPMHMISGPFSGEASKQYQWASPSRMTEEGRECHPSHVSDKQHPSGRPPTSRRSKAKSSYNQPPARTRDDLEADKIAERITEFYSSIKSKMTPFWPPCSEPRITEDLMAHLIPKLPVSIRTPAPRHFTPSGNWQRWSFLMDPEDFEIRHFSVLFITDPRTQYNVHFDTSKLLTDKCTATALTAECDGYRRYTRKLYDVSDTPTVLTYSEFKTWEHVPLKILRRRSCRILFDWIFDGEEGFWQLPIRTNLFESTEETAHPDYEGANPDDLQDKMPPCREVTATASGWGHQPDDTSIMEVDGARGQPQKRAQTAQSHEDPASGQSAPKLRPPPPPPSKSDAK